MKLFHLIGSYRYFVLGFILLLFLVARAILVPPLHDEIATLFYFVETGDILNDFTNLDANNHLFNSYLGRLLYLLFEPNLFVYRLPNILAFLLFFYSSIQIFKGIPDKKTQFLAVFALSATPFILEYFALTRGYGLGMSFMLFMLVKLNQWLTENSFSSLVFALLAGLLSVFSNLVFLNSFLITLGIVFLFLVYNYRKINLRSLIVNLSILILAFILVLPLINFGLKLRVSKALYYGDLTSFWEVTGSSLSKMLFQTDHYLIKYTLLLFVFGILSYVLFKSRRFMFNIKHNICFLMSIFFVGNLIAVFLLALIFNVNYPEDRAAIYLVVLGIPILAYAVHSNRIRGLFIILLIFPILFLFNLNFTHALVTPDQHLQKTFYNKVRAESINHPVTIYPTQHLAWAYYERNQSQKKLVSSSKTVSDVSDFYISRPPYSDGLESFEVLFQEKISNSKALERINKFKTELLYAKEFQSTEKHDEYINIDKIAATEQLNNCIIDIEIKGSLKLETNYKHCSLVFDATYEDGSNYYNAYPFHWYYSPKNSNFEFEVIQRLPKREELKNIKLYIWNKFNRNIKFIKGKYELRRIITNGTR